MFFKVLFVFLCVGVAVSAHAASVKLVGVADSQVRTGAYAGLYELEVDGNSLLAMCDDINTHVSIGDMWNADFYTFSDIQSGAPVKFAPSVEKYSQAGYLMNLLSSSSASEQADINVAIWEIMSPGSTTMNAVAAGYYNTATSGLYDIFDFTGVMEVLTPDPLSASQEYLVPSAVPIPTAVWLFGSGLLGLVGVARRN